MRNGRMGPAATGVSVGLTPFGMDGDMKMVVPMDSGSFPMANRNSAIMKVTIRSTGFMCGCCTIRRKKNMWNFNPGIGFLIFGGFLLEDLRLMPASKGCLTRLSGWKQILTGGHFCSSIQWSFLWNSFFRINLAQLKNI